MHKVILVDDEPVVLDGLSRAVRWAELSCVVSGTAADGLAALDLVRSERPDIVVCDIRMPKLDGLAFIERAREANPAIRFIILTGYRQFEYARRAVDLGVCRFLLKPTDVAEVEAAVRDAGEALRAGRAGVPAPEAGVPGAGSSGPALPDAAGAGPLARAALDLVANGFRRDLGLEDAASALGVSPWHLSKVVNRELGLSFPDLVNGARLREAARLLGSSTMKVFEVADAVGFRDLARFSRLFKAAYGATPSDYHRATYLVPG